MDAANTPKYPLKPWPTTLGIQTEALATFVRHYVSAGFELADSEDEIYGKTYEDFDVDNLQKVVDDCFDFLTKAVRLGLVIPESSEEIEQAGSDFWLTRNGHGSGFLDRQVFFGEYTCKALYELSKTYVEMNFVLGDNGKVYAEGFGKKPYFGPIYSGTKNRRIW